jgi:RND family efflux transporter MFP subunit
MNFRTTPVMRGPLRRTIRTVALVQHSEAAVAAVTTKFQGWVEKVYVDSTGQHVHRGDPLFEIYAPDLFSAQTEYVLSMNSGATGNEALKESARRKLTYLDISEEQIAELEKTRQPLKTLKIVSPIDGYVMEKMVVSGQMVEAGMKLYELVNHDTVWVQAQVYEQDLALVRVGQEAIVTITSLPGAQFRGRVTFIYPTLDEKTRTATVRTEFHNPGHLLKPGMYATAQIIAEISPTALLVPDTAVLRSGDKNTVFVELSDGHFDPRTVTLGARSENNFYQVLSGLNEGEHVVTSGQFMLDSESQLREAIQKMRGAQTGSNAVAETEASPLPTLSTGTNVSLSSAEISYICPMPEHVSIKYNLPGKCPLCGMALVPVSTELLARIQPGGKLEYYTCPMPEHADVHSDKPGKCPKCGMTLIPVMEAPPVPEATQLFTCPMASHADVVSDKPGECPKCGMTLVPTSAVAHGHIAEENWRKEHQK